MSEPAADGLMWEDKGDAAHCFRWATIMSCVPFVCPIQKALKQKDADVEIKTQAFDYICESTAFNLQKADRTEKIEVGIFIHTPPKLTEKEQEAFAKALVDALFDAGLPIPGLLIPLAK